MDDESHDGHDLGCTAECQAQKAELEGSHMCHVRPCTLESCCAGSPVSQEQTEVRTGDGYCCHIYDKQPLASEQHQGTSFDEIKTCTSAAIPCT